MDWLTGLQGETSVVTNECVDKQGEPVSVRAGKHVGDGRAVQAGKGALIISDRSHPARKK